MKNNKLDNQLKDMKQITDDFFRTDQCLGEGCFGRVYKGYWKSKNKTIAIKHIQLKDQKNDYAREISTLKTLSSLDHPNVIKFFGYQLKIPNVYLFLEFCPNNTLHQAIQVGLSQLHVLKYFRQMIEGMGYIHAQKIMHRDLKPVNILIGEEKQLKICDFGLSKETKNIEVTGERGTRMYAAPQVYAQKNNSYHYSFNCDIWSAGLILYEMLTKQPLFQMPKNLGQFVSPWIYLLYQWKQLEKGTKIINYNKNLHPFWSYFTTIMLTHDPKKRPSFNDVLNTLKKVYEQMENQIENKQIKTINSKQLFTVQNCLSFELQKYNILPQIFEQLTIQNSAKNFLNFTLAFLIMGYYLTEMKALKKNLENDLFTLPDSQNQDIELSSNLKIKLCVKKYHCLVDASYTYFSSEFSKTAATLLDNIQKNPQQKALFELFKNTAELVNSVNGGLFQLGDNYREELRVFVTKHYTAYDEKVLVQCENEHLQMIIKILLAATLDDNFPISKYKIENFVEVRIAEIMSESKTSLLKQFQRIKEILHGSD